MTAAIAPISANLAEGALLGPVNAKVEALQKTVALPAGTEIQASGDAEIMGEVFRGLFGGDGFGRGADLCRAGAAVS